MSKSRVQPVLLFTLIMFTLAACGGSDTKSSPESPAATVTPSQSKKEKAINKIMKFADQNSNPAPTVQDYIDAGITGVTSEALSNLNKTVQNLTAEDVDTAVEIKALTTKLAINLIPIANAGNNKTVQVNQSIKITGSGLDKDGKIIRYVWKKDNIILSQEASFNYKPTTVGTDTLTLTVTDNNKGTSSDILLVVVTPAFTPTSVLDDVKPIIILKGSAIVNITKGSKYVDEGATANDDIDANITKNIVVGGDDVNTNSKSGTTFTITYDVSDSAGNIAKQVTRTVIIITELDNIDPIIKLIGSNIIEVIQGSNYSEAGATALDNHDGDISSSIIIGGDVINTNSQLGSTFTLTYNVSDLANNSAIEVIRTVSIIADPNDGKHVIPALSEADRVKYLTIINHARAESRDCGEYGHFPAVGALIWSDELYSAAYEHSQDMTANDFFAHEGSGTASDWSGHPIKMKSSMVERVANYGFSWSKLSENISAGTHRDTPEEAMDSWLTSPGHCKNMMDPDMTQVGMAVSSSQTAKYTHYWTQDLAKE